MKYLLWVVAAVIALWALAMAISGMQATDEKVMSQDQETIDGCWEESRGTALTPTQQQTVTEACQMLEEVYGFNHGTGPRPAAVGA